MSPSLLMKNVYLLMLIFRSCCFVSWLNITWTISEQENNFLLLYFANYYTCEVLVPSQYFKPKVFRGEVSLGKPAL